MSISWRGKRGEWYVVMQGLLMFLVFFGPQTADALPEWNPGFARIARFTGTLLIIAGGALFLAAALRLGDNLTPLPHPKEGGTLIETGPYRIVRHPVYLGGIAVAYGWGLLVEGSLTLVYATVLLAYLDLKATREEKWLAQTYPQYAAYQRRVRKLIPFLR